MPLVATRGAASAQGFGEFGAVTAVNYIEDVFSTYLYTGTSSEQTINNGIDLAGKGGLVWNKPRNLVSNHELFDTTRGLNNTLRTNVTNAQATRTGVVNAFNSNGFTAGTYFNTYNVVTWTFRKQPKFFDVVTYTGNGVAGRTVPHSLGSVPGCIIYKCTSTTGDWWVLHRTDGTTARYGYLNLTSAMNAVGSFSTFANATTFSPGQLDSTLNTNGATYVAYLFAHDAGGFGLTGTDNVISCGSYNGTGSGTAATVNLGYEPQWILIKNTTSATDWLVADVMRGAPVADTATSIASLTNWLNPNTTAAESAATGNIRITSTGFTIYNSELATNNDSQTYIYIAIRRGPMKVPTSGTSVFGLNARSGTGANATVTGGQVDDAVLIKNRGSAVADLFAARLTGTGYLVTSTTAAEVAAGTTILQANPWDVMDGVKVGTTSTITNASSNTFINYLFRRAPGFFDVVCYTGNGLTNQTINHNLGFVPEFIFVKRRGATVSSWYCYNGSLGTTRVIFLNLTNASQEDAIWGNTAPTATNFFVSSDINVSATYIAYLFATCPGVSKVGSYTGTGTTKQIDCGFTGGARFVLIKRTDSTGDWYVWDSARGIVAGNDPYLLLNSTAAEVTNTDYIDTYSAGFEISSTAPAAINANGGTFIFLAIA